MRVAVWCDNHQEILDEGEIDSESSLLLLNDVTKVRKHWNCQVLLRLRSNCPKTVERDCK